MTAAARIHRRKLESIWRTERIYSMSSINLPDIKWVERFIVGITHPTEPLTQVEIQSQLDKVNRALRIGKLIALEQNIVTVTDGDKQIITQYTVYHVGFKHR